MKNILLLITVAFGFSCQAQNIYPENDYAQKAKSEAKKDSKMAAENCDVHSTGWVMETNFYGGFLAQDVNTSGMIGNYNSPINSNVSEVSFKNGSSFGVEMQGGCFFGQKKNFGIGLGLMYMYQQGDLTIGNFHVEYKSTDKFGNTFRQLVTSNGAVRESITTSNLNIPLVFKVKKWFNRYAGMSMDMGLLFNVLEQSNYTANSSFDYEAIYKYSGGVAVYENSPTPAAGDLLLTKQRYLSTHSSESVQSYFNSLSNQGYNVGLGVRSSGSGSVSFNTPSVGFIIRPAMNILLHEGLCLNLGAYYIYQNFSRDASSGYRIADRTGSYSPILNSVTNSVNHSAGVTIGIRYSFGNRRPAPTPAPAPEPEPIPAPAAPNDDEDDLPPPVDMTAPILFNLDKFAIREDAYQVLEEAVRQMNEHKHATLIINGYTDNTGGVSYNKTLSKNRANSVKTYLRKKGVRARSMKAIGHGENDPAASNATAEGRAKNRRVELRLKKAR